MKHIYVAGPYTKPDPVRNTRFAIHVGEHIINLGAIPFVPHLTHLWHLVNPHDIEYWYAFDLFWLCRCDALFRIPGESSGADKEIAFATKRNIPIFYNWSDLEAWINED